MKKIIIEILSLLIVVYTVISFSIAYIYQANSAKKDFLETSAYEIEQISQKIYENNDLIRTMEENLKKEYLVKARSVSLFLEHDENAIYNQHTLQSYMDLLTFDEIHFFDETGTIFAGTHPQYYGYSFESGEQMAFFAPLLSDKNLELAQDVTPNTAESKLIQYVAVWNEDKDMIVQIGHEPKHLLEALENTELSYLLPLMIDDADMAFIAYENSTREMLAATKREYVGKNLDSLMYKVISNTVVERNGERFHYYDGKIGDITLLMSAQEKVLYEGVFPSALVTTLIVLLITLTLMTVVMALLNSIIISPIFMLIKDMNKVGKGNLDIEMNIDSTPEFKSLSNTINQMIKNLLEYDIHTTRLFQSITIPIAMFEYSATYGEVKATGKLADILSIPSEEVDSVLKDWTIFSSLLDDMQKNKLEGEDDIYVTKDEERPKYLKIQSYSENNKVWGFIIDMTSELQKQEQIKKERDTDLLTGLSSRRSFLEKLQIILSEEQNFKVLVVLMLDLDNLKYVNDTFGHESGDTLILTAANLIKKCPCSNKLVARLGGDEFVVVAYGNDTKEDIRYNISTFHEMVVEATISVADGQKVPVSISGGYTFYGDYASTCGELLRAADEAMYKVKRNKKGSIIEYVPDVTKK